MSAQDVKSRNQDFHLTGDSDSRRAMETRLLPHFSGRTDAAAPVLLASCCQPSPPSLVPIKTPWVMELGDM